MDRWGEVEAENWTRDYKGDHGQLRLWLPKEEYIDESTNKYLDHRSQTKSEPIKNPSVADAEALTMHVHTRKRSMNFQNDFFHGGCGIPFLPQGSKQVDAEKEDADQALDADEGDSV